MVGGYPSSWPFMRCVLNREIHDPGVRAGGAGPSKVLQVVNPSINGKG